MSQVSSDYNSYGSAQDLFVADAQLSQRLGFLRRVYGHVFGAILAMVAIEVLLFQTGWNMKLMALMGSAWWVALILFMAVSWVATRLAVSGASATAQYSGLAAYVGLQSVLCAPILTIAARINPNLIGQAAFATVAITGALTLYVMVTKADFSFLRNALVVASFGILALAIGSAIFSFSAGLGISIAVVVLMCGYILYETSLIMHHLPVTAHVAGALMIFGSITVLFREILYLMLRFSED